MTIKILLKKYKQDETELFQFNNKNRIENWIKEGSGWIVESADSLYINISAFRSL